MNINQKQKLYSILFAAVVVLMGIVVLFGWVLDIPPLVQILPIFVPVQFNTALLLSTLGLGLLLINVGRFAFGRVFFGFCFVFAGLTILQYLTGWNFHIDELFWKAQVTTKTFHPGRMAPNTAFCFIFLGYGSFVFTFRKYRSRHWVAASLAAISVAMGLMSLIGYVADFEYAYGWDQLTDMAIVTGVSMILLGTSLFLVTITYTVKGKLSTWTIIPFGICIAVLTLLCWRAMEASRLYSLIKGYPYYPNSFILIIFFLFLWISVYLLKMVVGITSKQEDAQLEAEVNSQSKTVILRYVSHEIRNPLNAVLGFSESFIEDPSLSAPVKEAFDCIYTASVHMKNVVDDLLAISRFDSGKIRIDSHEYVFLSWINNLKKALGMRAQMQSIHFEVEFPEGMPEKLKGDASKLAQIVINLVENAFKYTPQEGNVKLSVWIQTDENQKDLLYIKVADTGRGIPQETQEQIFNPFFQVQGSDIVVGLGLGLSICKKYIDMMGGEITFTSEEGKGTEFQCVVEAYLS